MKRLPKIGTREFLIRLCIVILASLSPFICIFSIGVESSISAYCNTSAQPLFTVSNILVAYYFLSIKKWRVSAIMLIALTSFPVVSYGFLHNTLAILFFLTNLYPLYITNHYRWVVILYLSSLPVLLLKGILWAEIVAIESICVHQGLMLNKLYNLSKGYSK